MRTKRNVQQPEAIQAETKSPFFPYTSRDDSNGPVVFRNVTGTTPDGIERTHQYKKSKPYFSVSAEEDSNTINGIIPSSVDYRFIKLGLGSWIDLENKYSSAPAINRVILDTIQTGNLLLAVSVAEFSQTRSLVVDSFIRMYNLIFDLYRSAKKLDVREVYDLCSNAWLEYRYGWRPLVGELQSIVGLIRAKDDKSALLSKFALAGYKDIEDLSFAPLSPVFLQAETADGRTIHCVLDGTIDVKSILYKVSLNYLNRVDSRNASLLAQLGLDLDSIALTGWELIPFSFLLDMFTKTGNLLAAETFTADVRPFNESLSVNFDYEIKGTITQMGLVDSLAVVNSLFHDGKLSYSKYENSATARMRTHWSRCQIEQDGRQVNRFISLLRSSAPVSSVRLDYPQQAVNQNNYKHGTNITLENVYFDYLDYGSLYDSSTYHVYRQNGLWPLDNGSYAPAVTPFSLPLHRPYEDIHIEMFFYEYDPWEGGQVLLDELALSYHAYKYERFTNGMSSLSFESWLFDNYFESSPNIRLMNHGALPHPTISSETYFPCSFFVNDVDWVSYQTANKSLYRYYRPKLNPLEPHVIDTKINYTSTGRAFDRSLLVGLEYIPLLNKQLNKAQMADLAIFAERLTSAVLNSKK